MLYLLLGLVALLIIVVTTLKVERLSLKIPIFLGIGGLTIAILWSQGEVGKHVLHHVFLVDYVQFIPIPVATVLIASLGLFAIRVESGTKLGWFLWLICPIAGNFGTTWALVPIGLSLIPTLRRMYPDRWLLILMTVCIFSMNFLALGTLAADPPQALWAVKAASTGESLGFFFPATQFWLYMVFTMGLYWVVLKRLGVSFGNPSELLKITPEAWWKVGLGGIIVVAVIYSVTMISGYDITLQLGAVCLVFFVLAMCKVFGHHARHQTLHWVTETATIFVAFFSVVSFIHYGLTQVDLPNAGMIFVVIGTTLFADNAAAFAAAYPQYEEMARPFQTWFNLFNSVSYGGLSPLGNGPQITLFLVILVSLQDVNVTAKEIFVTWFREAAAFGPYLLLWTTSAYVFIEVFDKPFGIMIQIGVAVLATVASLQAMDLQKSFRRTVDNGNGD